MTRLTKQLSIGIGLWIVLLGFAAGAQDKAAAAPASDSAAKTATTNQAATPADSSAVRVRASHRVEVIAPGEHVDTVIDRMRSGTTQAVPATTDTQSATDRLQVRSPDLTRTGDHTQADHQRSQHSGGPPNGGPQNGNGPPPERR